MRHKGNTNLHNRQRDLALLQAYRLHCRQTSHIVIPDLFQRIVLSPAPRFFVDPLRAATVVSRVIRGDNLASMLPNRRDMYLEIHRRTILLLAQNPSLTLTDAVTLVVDQPAPRFYLTPASANVIINNLRRRLRRHKPDTHPDSRRRSFQLRPDHSDYSDYSDYSD